MAEFYTEAQKDKINALGKVIDEDLQRLGVGLTMGGEPTFVSVDDFESLQWRTEALGEEKRKLAGQLMKRLIEKFSLSGGLWHDGLGKLYPGEMYPRWALGYFWRKNGDVIWRNPQLLADDGQYYSYTHADAQNFIQILVKYLGIKAEYILPTYEDETEELAGYTLPLLPVFKDKGCYWSSCRWTLPQNKLYLLKGNATIGLRLPLHKIPWAELEQEAIIPLDAVPILPGSKPIESPPNSIGIALTVQVVQGTIRVFLPPLTSARSFLDLITALENTAAQINVSVKIEGYPLPLNVGIDGFQITPDPGVIEVNIHPPATWEELVQINQILYEEAHQCRLGTEKYLLDGRRISTGGGAHITIGGKTPQESPLLRRPDLLRSLISYWTNHPSLSYLFADLFVGSTSQSPRVDETKQDNLYELEIAFQYLKTGISTEVIDSLLHHLLVDITGNTHRTALCIDKLFPLNNPRNQLGLLEFRAFAMPPELTMRLLQMLLVRSLVAWFWQHPYTEPLIRWGSRLHDRFFLPYYIAEDFQQVIADLERVGYGFEFDWFKPFFDFRFPVYGKVEVRGIELELRGAIEPWNVLGDATGGGTSRRVDDTMERLQVRLYGATSRHIVTCNGYPVPLQPTQIAGESIGGVRFRARQYSNINHPALNIHSPLRFEIIDNWEKKSLTKCIYYASFPDEERYTKFPSNYQEAEMRRHERFMVYDETSQEAEILPVVVSSESPLTLDLRASVTL